MTQPRLAELVAIFLATCLASVAGVQLSLYLFLMPAMPDKLEPPTTIKFDNGVGVTASFGAPTFEFMHCSAEGRRVVCASKSYVFQSKKFY